MSDMIEMFKDIKKYKQEKRALNRENSAEMLIKAGIEFESKNEGAHLIIKLQKATIDFWPGTGLWIKRGDSTRHRGVNKLINLVRK